MSNFDNQKILHVAAGCLPPDDLLVHLLSKKPNVFGFVVQNLIDGKPDLAITREDATNMNLEDLKSLFENAKEFPLSLYFAKLADGYNPDDIQPFVINDGNNDPFMALLLEGTINGNDNPINRTEQFNLVNGIIIPKITEWCEDFEGDLDKIMAKVNGEVFKKDLMAHIGHRGLLHIVPLEGDVSTIGQNELGLTSDWGWISQKDGYGDVVEKAAEPVAEKKRGFWKGGGAKATSVPASPAKEVKSEVKDAATPGTSDRSKNKAPEIVARPPSFCHKNDDVKLWYNIVGNEETGQLKSVVPSAWKKRLPIPVKNQVAVKIDNLEAFKKYALERTLLTTGNAVNTEAQTSAGKPVATGQPPMGKLPKDITGVAGDVELPIIGPRELEAVLEIVAMVDSTSRKITDPKEMQKQETAYPLFSACVGVEEAEMRNWSVAGLFSIGKADYRAAVLMAIQYRNLYRNLKNGTVVQETDKAVTTTSTTGGTTKTESVSKEAPPAPKKSSGFWGKKAA